ncbi:MAG: TlpA family protein disulfide reductase [Candidatus Zixiibacteriota bacterium]|nr:MAG: TlpA family protein disulfide reductase [candidate division Zixibacteria bacterium]
MKHSSILASALAIMLLIGCSSSESNKESTIEGGQPAVKKPAAATFAAYDLKGQVRRFEEFKGKSAIILNFWGTWCPPCRRELPDLKRIYDEYQSQGLEIIGLAVNDTPDKVRNFSQKMGLNWVMLMANYEAAKSFRIGTGVPVSIFIDRNGNEIGRFTGARTYDAFKRYVDQMI